ncbi:MAG: hypothetical protein IBX68_07960, partial [Dehalococcoidia bacterium]|nr:hypothetical protein [Dehalococcoidia bacterium]
MKPVRVRLASVPVHVYGAILFCLLAAFGLLMRCVHLLNPDNHYILNADSHFFRWLSLRIISGEGPSHDAPDGAIWALHSGLAYPLAYSGKALQHVFGLSPAAAVDLSGKLLPPALALLTMAIIYFAAIKVFDRRTALFAVLAWAIMLHSVHYGGAGYLDRDGLTMLLIMVGALAFYFASTLPGRIRNRKVGWLAAGLAVLLAEGLLYLEWHYIGALLLLTVIAVYFVVRLPIAYQQRTGEVGLRRRLIPALEDANWRTLAVVAAGNALAAAVLHQQAPSWARFVIDMVQARGQTGV